jgi:hypothetical protein
MYAPKEARDTDGVMVCDDAYSKGKNAGKHKNAADVLAAIHRHNADNDKSDADKYGAVSFASPLYVGDDLVGFEVKSK